MSANWNYSFNPESSPKDAVRFLIGDTDAQDPLLYDLEIQYMLNQAGGAIQAAAIRCCEAIIAKFARLCDESVGQVKITFSQKMKAAQQQRIELTRRLATDNIRPYAGGISVTDIRQNNQNTDIPRPDFTKHMMENDQIAPWTTSTGALLGDQNPIV